MLKKKYVEEDSENEFSVDEPEEFQESSDDWTPGTDGAKSRKQTRSLRTRNAKMPKLAEPSSSEEEEESEEIDSEEETVKKRRQKGRPAGRGRPQKKVDVKEGNVSKESVLSCEATSTTEPNSNSPVQKEFSSGAYVVLKTDFQNNSDPPIWKIDGKALLQKYVAFEQDGKKLYKNTSTYSGWSIANKDMYYPAPITFKVQNRKEIIVEFHKEQIKPTPENGDDSE